MPALIIALTLYFLPTIIALIARRENAVAILLLNLFLGWTGVGWIVAIVWCAVKPKDRDGDRVVVTNQVFVQSPISGGGSPFGQDQSRGGVLMPPSRLPMAGSVEQIGFGRR